MGGGLMQLVAYGAQDIYLTGNPQITFFKVVYRRHTNFSMETIEQTINGASTTAGGSGTVTISRNGDLVHTVYVSSSTASIVDGDEIVAEVEIEIGGQRIDRHFKEWNQIWNELTTPESKALGLKSMKGCVGSSGTTGVGTVYVPLNFWFCRNPGLALPLIALQYHEVKLKFTWGAAAGAVGATAACKVWCDYIYLDTDERRRFAQVSHEYLIEQLQSQSATAGTSSKLNFNHPVKELIWTSNVTNSYGTAQLKLNGHDRFSEQEEEYFQLRQPYDYHTAVPSQNLPTQSLISALNSSSYTELLVAAFKTGVIGENFNTTSNVTQVSTAKCRVMGIDGTVLATGDTAGATAILFKASDGAVHNLTAATLVAGDYVIVTTSGTKGLKETPAKVVASTIGATEAVSINGVTSAAFVDSYILVLDTHIVNDINGDPTTNLTILSIKKLDSVGSRTSKMTKKINVYSFGLKPEEHQPSGTCNFSRIDNAQLDTGVALSATDTIYAVNYNVLRIMSGMGGLAYSN